jgi:hypothetical protein
VEFSNFAINLGCINKIPLNPPLQKGEAVGMLGLIEMLQKTLSAAWALGVIFFAKGSHM